MATSPTEQDVENQSIYQHFRDIVSTLPSSDGFTTSRLYRHSDGWYATFPVMVSAMVTHHHFKARPTDVLLVTFPKSGTTWLKALLFATLNRGSPSNSRHTLSDLSPHEYVPFLESQVYINDRIPVPDLNSLPSPRLFATHIPFRSLPESVVDSGCKIIYLCRDPRDNFTSLWHFVNHLRAKAHEEPLPLVVAFEMFCRGVSMFGPYWDHALGYWKESLERPQGVLFLKYEDMMEDPVAQLRRMAEFVGCPFTDEEDEDGAAGAIVKLCAFERLSGLDVNKIGRTEMVTGEVENSAFFRRGAVGDWVNLLTPEMVRRLEEIAKNKFGDSGLTF